MKTLFYFSQKPYAVQKSVRLLLAVCMVLFVSSNLYAGWVQVGTAGFSAGTATYMSLAIDSSNTPYVAYQDMANSQKASVMKFDGANWVQVGTAGFSAGQADYISLAIDSSNTPYVTYQDMANSQKASVMKFDGTNWVQVGAAGFSAGTATYISLAIDGGNTPVVAYTDNANGGKASVMKFDGASWVQVGTAGFSAAGAGYNSLAIDSSNTPVVAYQDGANAGKASVMKFDGTSWVQVGTAGFSAAPVGYTSLAIDSSNTPVMAYQDGANSQKASVMKFDGTNWVQVGAAGFSADRADYTSLAIDSGNTPVVAYTDNANGNKASVMKFDGANWVQVGTAGFSAGTATYMSLAIDSSNTPVAAYQDWANSNKASVMKYITDEPENQANSLNFTSVTGTSMTFEWTRGDGANCIVVMKSGSAVDSDPVDLTAYTADAAFGTGSETGTGNYVVYSGTGSTVTVTGLTAGTTYHVAVYEYNGSGGTENYLISTPASGNIITAPGNALDFTGSNNYVEMNDFQLGTSDFTIEFWMNGTAGGIDQYVLTNRTSEGDANGNWFVCNYLSASQSMGFGMAADGSGGGGGVNSLDGAIPAGVWHHVAITRDGTMITIFIDGVQNNQTTDSFVRNLTVTSNTARFGDWVGYNRPYQGKLDEVRIWNTPRSQADIQNNMNTTLTGNEAGLVAYYRFDRGTACGNNTGINTLPDLTSNGNDGTLYNFDLSTPDCSSNWTTADWNYGYPYVTTDNVTNITGADAVVGGNVVNEGTSAVTARGICWNTTGNPTISDANISMGSGPGPFSGSMTGLTAGETYYVRAYAVNTGGTVYGEQDIFTPVMPPPGNALDFGGADDYVSIPSAPLLTLSTPNFTVESWVYLNDNSTTQYIANNGWASHCWPGWSLGIGSIYSTQTGKAVFIINRDNVFPQTNYTEVVSTEPVPVGQWVHIAASYDGSNLRLYINGVLNSTVVTSGLPYDYLPTITLGSEGNSSTAQLNGVLDEVRIWNVARTQAQIKNRMNNVIDPATPGLTAYYRFDNVSGTTLPDLTANANNGTLVNGPVWTDSEAFTVWTGAVSTEWNNAANWSDGVPTASDNVSIPAGALYSPEISTSGQCGHLVIQSGAALNIPGTGVLNVYGNWINLGTCNAGNSTVILSGQNQAVYGSNTFYNLQKAGTGIETLKFAAGSTQTVTGELILSDMMQKSTMPGTQWNIDAQGTVSASGLDVQDANAVTLIDVRGQGCTDSGNNVNWIFDNTAPVVNLDPDNSLGGPDDGNNEITFTEGGSPVSAADMDAAVTDAEDAVMQTLTLTVTGIADGTDEIITIGGTDFPQNADKTTGGNAGSTVFTLAYTQSTGIFLITGQGGAEMPLADLNLLIRGITYVNMSENPTSGDRILAFTANDGFADSLSVQSVITVNAVNDAPVIESQNPLSTNEDTALTIQFTDLTVTDPDNAYPTGFILTVQSGTDYTVSGTTVTPVLDFNGTLTVPVLVNDGTDDSSVFSLSVTVNPVNDAPVIASQNPLSTDEDTALTIQFTDLTVTDPDNAYPTGFTLTVQSGTDYTVSGTTVTPIPDFNGTLTVPVLVNDGTDDSNVFSLSVTVIPVNDAPVIESQNPLSTDEDTALTIQFTDLLVTDPDNAYPTGFTLTVQSGTNYTVSGTQITPALNYTGPLTVPVLVNDGGLDSNVFSLSVTVIPVNDAPVIESQNPLSTDEDTALTIQFTALTVTDPDNAYPTGFTLTVQTGSNYTVSGTTVTPVLDFNGTLTVPVLVNDGTDDSSVFSLSVTVNAVNDAPVIDSQNAVSIPANTSLTIVTGFLSVTDPDSFWPDDFTVTAGDGANYTRTGNIITADTGFAGTLTVPVTVNDGTADSIPFPFVITVTALNIPVITGQTSLTTAEDTPLTLTLDDLTVSDPDSVYPDDFTLSVQTGSSYTVSGTTVIPAPDFSGNLTVSVMVNDGTNDSSVFNVSITVTPANDAPLLDNTGEMALTAIDEDAVTDADNPGTSVADILLSGGGDRITDPDAGAVEGIAVTSAADSTGQWQYDIGAGFTSFPAVTETAALLLPDTAVIRFVPDTDFSGLLSPGIVFRAWDQTFGTGGIQADVSANGGITTFSAETETASVMVNPVNDAPVITGQTSLSIPENTAITVALSHLTVTDPDNTWPDGFILTVPAGDNYTVSGTTVTPDPGFSGILRVSVMVNDGELDSESYPLSVAVDFVNDAPIITGQNPLSTDEDVPLAIQLTDLTVSDADSEYPADFTLTVQPGTAYTVSGNLITPAADYSGSLTVPVQVNDGISASNVYNLTVTVNPVNDAPVITGQTEVSMSENTAIVILLSHLTVTDPDNMYPDGFTLTVLPGTAYTVSGTTVTPVLDFTGTLTVPLTVNDGISDSSVFSFVITVNGENDALLITGQNPLSVNEDTPIVIHLTDIIVSDPENMYPSGFSLTVQPGSNYTVSGTTLTPAQNYNGPLTVPALVNDGTQDSNIFNLTISVTPVNDVPVIIGQTALSIAEDTPFTVHPANLIVDEPDGDPLSLTVMPGQNYTVSGNTVTPAKEFSGLLTIPVTVSDGKAVSDVFMLTVRVSFTDDQPVITAQSVLITAEETGLTVTLNDLTGDDPDTPYPAGFTLTLQAGENYTLSGNTVTPVKDFYGSLRVPVTVNDGKSSSNVFILSVSVSNVNDPPLIISEPVLKAVEDEPWRYEITVSDPDPEDSFTVTSDNLPPWLRIEGTVLSGTPGNDDTGEYQINLTLSDGNGGRALQSFTLAVEPVNDAPVIIANNTRTTTELTPLTVTFNDLIVEDPDSIYPEEFTLTLYPGKNYSLEGQTVTPPAGFAGTLTVPVTVNDGYAESPRYDMKVEVTERPEIRSISGTVTNLEKDRELWINAVSRSLDDFEYIILRGTGEPVIPYIIEHLKPSHDFRVEISSTDYPYQVYRGKESWEEADAIDISERNFAGADFVLPPPVGEISGRIFLPDTARAGQSVLLRASSASAGASGAAEIILEENGAWDVFYRITRLLPADDYTVSLSSDSYLTRYFSGDGGTGVAREKDAFPVSTGTPDGPEVNFVPDAGVMISGTVTAADLSGLRAEAWSDSLDAGSGAFVSADGTFAISGLESAGDFKVSVLRPEGPPLYYHPDGAVYDRNASGPVSTWNGNVSGIDIGVPEEKSISGTVRDAAGNPLSGIWVEAQSDSQTAGGSAFSPENGNYEIQGLVPGSDYRVSARPDRHSPYAPQEKTGIAAGARNADFVLEPRSLFRISGHILDADGEPVPNVRVEISSDSLDIFVTSADDFNGKQDLHIPKEYKIDGLPAADDYTVTARPSADAPFAVFVRSNVSIRQDTDMNIVLTPALSMSGTVTDAADGSPVADARVTASSERRAFRAETRTPADGTFVIGNMPDIRDYRLTVTAEGYTDAEMTDLSPSGDIRVELHRTGIISGTVRDENGSPLSGVPVEIFSLKTESDPHFGAAMLTGTDGEFALKGLRAYHDDGSPAEYTVTAYPEEYPPAGAENIRPGETVNLTVIPGEEFSGTVRNADGSLLTGADLFIDIFEIQGEFVLTADTEADGTFRNASLDPDTGYELRFMVYAGENLLLARWAGKGGMGVNDRADAVAYSSGTPLDFRFSETVRIPSSLRRNAVHRADRSGSGETAVRNLRSVPRELIYRDGTVTAKWDPSLQGEDPETGEKYYYIFSRESGFAVTKRTAPRSRPVTVRRVTENGLRGNNTDFHCYVAAVDARGQIGETRSVTFRSDTVPPLNPKISVPAKTTLPSVSLELAAGGAVEIYLSNITYGQGGNWESLTQRRTWELTEGDGLKKIYARFRDRAGNTVNAFAATEKIPDFDPDTQHKITVETGPGGKIIPAGEVIVNSGDDLTLAVTPDTGYGTGTVTVDNIPVRLNNDSQFTLVSIRADHTFAVTFTPASEKTHVITATAGPYGSISPSGKITVPEGADQAFSIVPVEGYGIAEVLADGQPVTPDADGGFVFRNVTGDHSISVTFR